MRAASACRSPCRPCRCEPTDAVLVWPWCGAVVWSCFLSCLGFFGLSRNAGEPREDPRKSSEDPGGSRENPGKTSFCVGLVLVCRKPGRAQGGSREDPARTQKDSGRTQRRPKDEPGRRSPAREERMMHSRFKKKYYRHKRVSGGSRLVGPLISGPTKSASSLVPPRSFVFF